ncbi:MAG: Addiction module toxin, RelE/StbE family [candidate division CPR1 bacterium GW2011_GWC1_49_13]|uniref:Addiction module toxin, RelE/StbE family n=1 Tax=candidate division CPR1 bacterium GW2011_GWC1_49_13 TaxID=1618342 RepID=A0A0G1VH19_9BACT|nr:MAG: Addiction module toxin, RelE/StbE family [candidate division CPR1 bacterium GW2011_GWC1_49_13]
MAFSLVYSATARKDIEKLDSVVKKRIGKKILILQTNPFKYSKKLTNLKSPLYRLRVGDYRIVYQVVKNQVFILRVGHRSTIYR